MQVSNQQPGVPKVPRLLQQKYGAWGGLLEGGGTASDGKLVQIPLSL